MDINGGQLHEEFGRARHADGRANFPSDERKNDDTNELQSKLTLTHRARQTIGY